MSDQPAKPRLKIPFTLVPSLPDAVGVRLTFTCPELDCSYVMHTPQGGTHSRSFQMHDPEKEFLMLDQLLAALKQKYGEDEFNLRLHNANVKRDAEMKADEPAPEKIEPMKPA